MTLADRLHVTYPPYHSMLSSKRFNFSHSQVGRNIGGAREDVYSHPDYQYNIYIGPVEANGPITLHTGLHNASILDAVRQHDITSINKSSGHISYAWSERATAELIATL